MSALADQYQGCEPHTATHQYPSLQSVGWNEAPWLKAAWALGESNILQAGMMDLDETEQIATEVSWIFMLFQIHSRSSAHYSRD